MLKSYSYFYGCLVALCCRMHCDNRGLYGKSQFSTIFAMSRGKTPSNWMSYLSYVTIIPPLVYCLMLESRLYVVACKSAWAFHVDYMDDLLCSLSTQPKQYPWLKCSETSWSLRLFGICRSRRKWCRLFEFGPSTEFSQRLFWENQMHIQDCAVFSSLFLFVCKNLQ